MPKKRHKPEEIVAKLRQVDVLVAQGKLDIVSFGVAEDIEAAKQAFKRQWAAAMGWGSIAK